MTSRLDSLGIAIGLASRGHLSKPLNPSWQWRGRSATLLSTYFLTLCEDLGVALLLELGAQRADTSIAFVRRSGGRAIAFVANPVTFAALTKPAATWGVEVRNVAVGRTAGQATLHIPVDPSGPLTSGSASLLETVIPGRQEKVSVPMTTIDDIVATTEPTTPVALWVDVEGLAHDVLSGGRALLSDERCRLIMVEVEGVAKWRGQATSGMVDALLRDHDFVPVMRDAQWETQYNVVYVKAQLVDAIENQISLFWGELAAIRPSYRQWVAHAVGRRVRALAPGARVRRRSGDDAGAESSAGP